MKRFTKITVAVIALLLSSTSLTWAQQPAAKSSLSVMDMLKSQKKSTSVVMPLQPQPVTPAIPPVVQEPSVPVIEPIATAVVPQVLPVALSEVTPPLPDVVMTSGYQPPAVDSVADNQLTTASVEEKDQAPATDEYGVPKDVRKSLENDFKDKLKFSLTQEKMVAYIRATAKVEAVNSRWDVEVAAAATDQIAMENNNFAVEDITATLSSMTELTIEQYNELTALTSKNKNFADLVNIYRDLVKSGTFKRQPTANISDPKTVERLKAVQDRIDNMKAELWALHSAPLVTVPAQVDPVLAAQMDALTAKAQQVSNRIEAINQRAADIEKKVKTN